MASLTDERATPGHRPFGGMRRMRPAVTLLGLHEQDFGARLSYDFGRLRHRWCVDPIFGIKKELAAGADRLARLLHLLHDALEHQRLWDMADRYRVAGAAEISGKRLLADHVFAGLH